MEISFEQLDENHKNDVIDIFNYYIETTTSAYREHKLNYSDFQIFLDMSKKHSGYAINNPTNEIIGFCILKSYSEHSTFSESAELMYFLKNEYTGIGIGKKIIEKMESDARKQGVRKLFASISSENEVSLKFHNKNGFIECGRHPNVGKKFNRYFDIVWVYKDL